MRFGKKFAILLKLVCLVQSENYFKKLNDGKISSGVNFKYYFIPKKYPKQNVLLWIILTFINWRHEIESHNTVNNLFYFIHIAISGLPLQHEYFVVTAGKWLVAPSLAHSHCRASISSSLQLNGLLLPHWPKGPTQREQHQQISCVPARGVFSIDEGMGLSIYGNITEAQP